MIALYLLFTHVSISTIYLSDPIVKSLLIWYFIHNLFYFTIFLMQKILPMEVFAILKTKNYKKGFYLKSFKLGHELTI